MKFLVKSCDSITCDTCKYKEDCELINKFINDIKDKGLSPDQYVRGLLLSVKIVVLFHLLMMEELNSETMILLLSVLISNCNFCNSTVCEDSAINIYHSPSVICHILFGVNYSIIIDCEISNNIRVKHFVYMISYL